VKRVSVNTQSYKPFREKLAGAVTAAIEDWKQERQGQGVCGPRTLPFGPEPTKTNARWLSVTRAGCQYCCAARNIAKTLKKQFKARRAFDMGGSSLCPDPPPTFGKIPGFRTPHFGLHDPAQIKALESKLDLSSTRLHRFQ